MRKNTRVLLLLQTTSCVGYGVGQPERSMLVLMMSLLLGEFFLPSRFPDRGCRRKRQESKARQGKARQRSGEADMVTKVSYGTEHRVRTEFTNNTLGPRDDPE